MKYLRFLLFPLAVLYDIVTTIRNKLFSVGFFKETSFKIPVITVGNLNVGGTGKTPQIEYLIRLLKNNYSIAVLSRGYNRSTKGFVLLNKLSIAKEVGDEPLQYFNKFKNITVAVDANRVNGISNIITAQNPEVILLDDAFQHRKVKASFYVLLTKYKDLFVDDFLLPTGNLRENRNGAERADAIIVTKCPKNISSAEQKKIQQQFQHFKKPLFFSTITYAEKIRGTHTILTSNLKDYEIILITGIANPKPLLQHLKNLEINFNHLKYSDHHNFTKKEIQQIQKIYSEVNSKNKILLTTEKDYTRLSDKLDKLSYLPIETKFLKEQKKDFDAMITTHIGHF